MMNILKLIPDKWIYFGVVLILASIVGVALHYKHTYDQNILMKSEMVTLEQTLENTTKIYDDLIKHNKVQSTARVENKKIVTQASKITECNNEKFDIMDATLPDDIIRLFNKE